MSGGDAAMQRRRVSAIWPFLALVVAIALLGAVLACTSHNTVAASAEAGVDVSPTYTTTFPRDALLDAQTCKECHPKHYADWAQSVHAHSSDDPIFIAMNKRGQRETGGELKDFCVKCHAPMAVHDGKTTDGLNLSDLDPKYRGVTCYFCHNVTSVSGSHNAALSLSDDVMMHGEYSNAISNNGHTNGASGLFDRDLQDSATMCGSCHDIVVNRTGAFIERTFCEWSHSAFDAQYRNGGQSCITCHMVESNGVIANFPNAPSSRQYHQHDFPAVDTPLDAPSDAENAAVQQFLASTFQGALCVTQGNGIRVILDPVMTGHNWPSGAAQDRRAWAELVAYAGGNVIYQSGALPDSARAVAVKNDPDLWLIREQMYDTQGNPVSMFWQAASTLGNAIPALATFDQLDPAYYQTHVEQFYPRDGGTAPLALSQQPDRVTLRMRLQPVGLDVLDDLVDSGDLDPSVVGKMSTYDVSFLTPEGGVSPMLEWTPGAVTSAYPDEFDQTMASCVSTASFNVNADKVSAPGFAPPTNCVIASNAAVSSGSSTDSGMSDTAVADADAAAVCDPRYTPDPITGGLSKIGSAGAMKFVLVSPDPQPPGVGYNTWVVNVVDSQGQPIKDAIFTTIKPWMPLHGHGSSVLPTWISNGDGTYSIRLYLFMPGVWQVTLTVQNGPTKDTVVFALCVGG
jgi:hypothetical protein